MQFPIQIDILDFIFKGLLIGIISSAPMGPVGILCIQRTLNKGRWYGLSQVLVRLLATPSTHSSWDGYELYYETVTEPYLSAYPADFW